MSTTMSAAKGERQAAVERLTEQLKSAGNVYVTDFSGLNVLKITEFRRRLRVAGARYVVVKNTLAKRALEASQMGALAAHMSGPVGLVLAGRDPLAAAKVVGEFAKEHQKPTFAVGFVAGKPVEAAYVKRLGELPGREVLLGEFAGCLNGMLYQVVGALEALRDQRQAQAS
jgi:large subunit ribosomal protein L10